MLASCPENRSRCCHLSADVCRGNVACYLELVDSRSLCTVLHASDDPHGGIQLYFDEIGRPYVQSSSKLEHSTQPHSRGPSLMYE